MTIKVSDLEYNPFRKLRTYPVDRDKVEALKTSPTIDDRLHKVYRLMGELNHELAHVGSHLESEAFTLDFVKDDNKSVQFGDLGLTGLFFGPSASDAVKYGSAVLGNRSLTRTVAKDIPLVGKFVPPVQRGGGNRRGIQPIR